jgi:glycosyltransferase involved in cell wall biosynthesis
VRILVIPAVLNTPLRHRGAEIARALGARHRVVVLFGERQPPELGRAGKLWWHARQALSYGTRRLSPTVTALRLPSLPRWPALSRRYQGALLALLTRAWRVGAVVTQGTGDVCAPRPRGVRIVYDLPDNHMAGLELEGKHEAARAIRAFVAGELRRATAATASSRVLVRILEREFGTPALLVPNGVPVHAYRAIAREVTESLRERLRLGTGPVLGFTGGLDWWVDVPLAVAALAAVRRARPEARLLVVGDGSRAGELRAAGAGIIVTGFVPPADVPAHVALFDVGLVPFVKNALTDAMLPIKIFDYGAARKPAVSTPLDAYAGEDLPFLRVAAPGPEPLAAAVGDALRGGWDPAWDAAVDRYDWARVVEPLERLLAG